jgi:hypothetical protein
MSDNNRLMVLFDPDGLLTVTRGGQFFPEAAEVRIARGGGFQILDEQGRVLAEELRDPIRLHSSRAKAASKSDYETAYGVPMEVGQLAARLGKEMSDE